MATTYAYGGSNTTASTARSIAPIKLGIATNYGEVRPKGQPVKPGIVWLANSTCATNIDEDVRLTSKSISVIDGLVIPVRFPAPTKEGVAYGAEIQAILRETKDDGTIVDHPIKMTMSIAHGIHAPFTDVPANGTSYVYQALCRLLGAFFADDGSERFAELAKGLVKPEAN